MLHQTDPSPPSGVPSHITLVLGGGWKLGGAFHSGVMLALHDVWGLDPRRVDTLIGTSSGAVVAGLLAAGVGAEDLYRRETGARLSDSGHALLMKVMSPHDHWCEPPVGESHVDGRGASVGAGPQQRSAAGALVGLLPRGTRSMAPLEQYFDGLVGPVWPTETDLQLCAVELGSGRRVALTRECGVTVGRAVAASCSIPGVSEPVRIDDREFVDGAIHSINNADLAVVAADAAGVAAGARREAQQETSPSLVEHTVIVSAPLSASRVQLDPSPLALLRNAMRAQTRLELRKLKGADRVVLMEPTVRDLIAMGSNLNANNRRPRVAARAYRTACAILAAVEAPSHGPGCRSGLHG